METTRLNYFNGGRQIVANILPVRGENTMTAYALKGSELIRIEALVEHAFEKQRSVKGDEFLGFLKSTSKQLPNDLAVALTSFKMGRDESLTFIISGYSIDDTLVGRTPIGGQDSMPIDNRRLRVSLPRCERKNKHDLSVQGSGGPRGRCGDPPYR